MTAIGCKIEVLAPVFKGCAPQTVDFTVLRAVYHSIHSRQGILFLLGPGMQMAIYISKLHHPKYIAINDMNCCE